MTFKRFLPSQTVLWFYFYGRMADLYKDLKLGPVYNLISTPLFQHFCSTGFIVDQDKIWLVGVWHVTSAVDEHILISTALSQHSDELAFIFPTAVYSSQCNFRDKCPEGLCCPRSIRKHILNILWYLNHKKKNLFSNARTKSV